METLVSSKIFHDAKTDERLLEITEPFLTRWNLIHDSNIDPFKSSSGDIQSQTNWQLKQKACNSKNLPSSLVKDLLNQNCSNLRSYLDVLNEENEKYFGAFEKQNLTGLKHVRNILRCSKLVDFSDMELKVLSEIHDMTQSAKLILENRVLSKKYDVLFDRFCNNLNLEIPFSNFKLENLNVLECLSFCKNIIGFEENTRLFVQLLKKKNNYKFYCEACCIFLNFDGLTSHFVTLESKKEVLSLKSVDYEEEIIQNRAMELSVLESECDSLQKYHSNTLTKEPSQSDVFFLSKQHTSSTELNDHVVEVTGKSNSMKNTNSCVFSSSLSEKDVSSYFREIGPENKPVCICLTCNIRIFGSLNSSNRSLLEHLSGSKHKRKLEKQTKVVLKNQVTKKTDSNMIVNSKTFTNSALTRSSLSEHKIKESSVKIQGASSDEFSKEYSSLMNDVLKTHLKGEVALNERAMKLKILGFYCQLCNYVIHTIDDWSKHLISSNHKLKKGNNPAASRMYHCLICKIVIYCNKILCIEENSHILSQEHRLIKNLLVKRCPTIENFVKLNRRLNFQINSSFSLTSFTLNQNEVFYNNCSLPPTSTSPLKPVNVKNMNDFQDHIKFTVDTVLSLRKKNDRISTRTHENILNLSNNENILEEKEAQRSNDEIKKSKDKNECSHNGEYDDDNNDGGDDDADDDDDDEDNDDDDDGGDEDDDDDDDDDNYGNDGDDDAANIDIKIIETNEKENKETVGKAVLKNEHGVKKQKDRCKNNSQSPRLIKTIKELDKMKATNSITFKGVSSVCTESEWMKRFAEMGRFTECYFEMNTGTAIVWYSKRKTVRKILLEKEIIQKKYQINAFDTGKLAIDEKCISLLKNRFEFTDKIDAIIKAVSDKSNSEKAVSKLACIKKIIQAVIHETYPTCKIYEFGSQVSGLATGESDYDFYIDFSGKAYLGVANPFNDPEKSKMVKEISKIADILRKFPALFSNIVPILSARVPILKIKYIPTASHCDLSFKNGLSVENTTLIRKYLSMNPNIKWLIFAVKSWAQVCGLLSSCHFTTYALIWLVLFFLMNAKIVPPVSVLMNVKNKQKISGWHCNISSTPYVCEFKDTKEKILLEFFSFYLQFDFWKLMICTRSGTAVRRVYISEVIRSKIPVEIQDYIRYVYASTNSQRFIMSACSVQDPFDLSHNITKQVKPSILKKFQYCCHLAALEISSWSSIY